MANRIRSIFASIDLNTDAYLKNLKEVQKENAAFEKKFAPLTKTVNDFGKTLTGVGVAVSAVGIPFGVMAGKAIDAGDALDEMAARTGASVEVLSAVGFQAKQAGASMESVEKAFKASSKVMEDAATGSKAAADSLNKLGLSSRDLFAMNPDQRLFAIGGALNDIKDPGEKAALAMEVLGRAGTELIPIMGSLAEGQDAVMESARSVGGVMSTEAAAAAGQFNDALDNLSTSITGIFNAMVSSGLLPAITDFVNGIAQMIAKVTQANPLLVSIGAAIGGLALVVGPAVAGVGLLIQGFSSFTPAAMQALTSIKAIGVGLPAINIGAVAATAGVVGLGAALGVGIGMLINYGLKVTGLEKELDKLTGTLFSGRVAQANAQLSDATLKLSQRLESVGIFIDRGTDSVEDWNKRVTEAARNSGAFSVSLSRTEDAAKKSADKIAELNDTIDHFTSRATGTATGPGQILREGFEKAKEAADELQEKLKEQQESLREEMEISYQRAMDLQAGYAAVKESSDLEAQAALFEQMERDYSALQDFERQLAALKNSERESLRQKMEADYQTAIDFQKGLGVLRQQEAEKMKQAAADNAKALKDAINDVGKSAGEIFDAMFLKGENVFKSLQNALKGGALSIGRSIFQDVVGELGGPIKKAFDDFFQGLLNSTGIKNFLKGLGDSIGGILGKITGGGGFMGPQLPGAGGGFSAAKFGKFMTNPWTIAVGAGIAAVVGVLKSQAHHEANTFVREFQNPFAEAVGDLAGSFFEAAAAGQITADAAKEARDQVEELWQEFQRQADEFAKGGSDELKVVNQMFQHMRPLMDQVLADMEGAILQLPEEVDDLTKSTDDLGKATKDAGRYTINFTGDVDDLSDAAFDAARAIKELTDAIEDLGVSARSPSGGGGSSAPVDTRSDAARALGITEAELNRYKATARSAFNARGVPGNPIDAMRQEATRGEWERQFVMNAVYSAQNPAPTNPADFGRWQTGLEGWMNSIPVFDNGGIAGRAGLAWVDKNELMIPEKQWRGGGGMGGGVTIHVHIQNAAGSMRELAERIHKEMLKGINEGGGWRPLDGSR